MAATLDDEIAQLSANPVLTLLDQEALRLIAFSSDTRILRKDDILFREGEKSDGGYFVVSGSIVLEGDGKREVHGVSSLIGETALFTETERPATATVLETTVVRRIPRHLMRRVLTEFPLAAQRLRQHFLGKLGAVSDAMARAHALLPAED
jgi:CRP-like cAMP-binding protein